jgi:hypothetical protein
LNLDLCFFTVKSHEANTFNSSNQINVQQSFVLYDAVDYSISIVFAISSKRFEKGISLCSDFVLVVAIIMNKINEKMVDSNE